MMGGTGRPTRMNRSAVDALVDRSGRQVRLIQLLAPRMGGFLLPATPTWPLAGVAISDPAGPARRGQRALSHRQAATRAR